MKHALQNLSEVLRQGSNIIIFPEGTRSIDGSLAPFRKTYAILSRELGIPIVPVAISGAWRALPKGARLPRLFAPIEIEYLQPVAPGQLSYDELNEAVRSRISAAVGEY
jgi:long-chain acyl-CoA synthetase